MSGEVEISVSLQQGLWLPEKVAPGHLDSCFSTATLNQVRKQSRDSDFLSSS